MKKNLSFLFVLAFILLGATYAISGPLYINTHYYGEYSAISVGSNGRVDITATTTQPSGNTIAGRVTSGFFGDGKTIGIAGVTMALSGSSSGTSTTDTNGNYTFTGLAAGSYTVAPSQGSYTFNPASGSANVASNQTATVNFDASPVQGKIYSIAGNVKDKNAANLPGVTMQLKWGSTVLDSTDLTGADGNYVIENLADGLTYIITPIMTGKSFNPTSQNVLVNGSNVAGKNFVEQSGPSGALGTKTNPIPINIFYGGRSLIYYPSTATNGSVIRLGANSKIYFVVDSQAATSKSVRNFYFIVKGYNNSNLVYTKVPQSKATGQDLVPESLLQYGVLDAYDVVGDMQLYELDNTKFLYAIENRGPSFDVDVWVQFML